MVIMDSYFELCFHLFQLFDYLIIHYFNSQDLNCSILYFMKGFHYFLL